MADLGAVEFEALQAQGFGGGEAVGTRRGAGEAFLQQGQHGCWPRRGVVATGSAGRPERLVFLDARGVVSGGQRIETAAGETQFGGGLGGGERVLAEGFEHMTDEDRRVTMVELLVFFKAAG